MSRPNAPWAERAAMAVLAASLAGGCETPPPARLDLGEATVERVSGATAHVVARFEMRNSGGRELLLHGVTLDCGCRLVSALPESLARGERTTLAVRCRTTADSTRPRELQVLSSDADEPRVSRRFTLPARAPFAAAPAALYFGYVAVGASAAREITVPARSAGAAAGGARAVASAAVLTVEARPARADGRSVYRVRFAPNAPGPFHGSVDLGDDGGVVSVTGVGFRNVLAFPAEVVLPSEVTPGAAAAIALKSVAAAPLTIAQVELPPGISGELQTTTPGREFRLVLHARGAVDANGPPIRLHTSADDEPVVTIPLRDGNA